MEQRHLGRTGLRVSRLGLGTMSWGRDTDEHEAADQFKMFLDAGGTLVDTADVYADGDAPFDSDALAADIDRAVDVLLSHC